MITILTYGACLALIMTCGGVIFLTLNRVELI